MERSMLQHRLAGLIAVCTVIFALYLMAFSSKPFHRRLSQMSLEGRDGTSSNALLWGRVVPLEETNSEVAFIQDKEIYAPIIVGAGQGTTGTHLFAEVTCQLGFVSLHFAIGCLPSNAIISVKRPTQESPVRNLSAVNNATTHWDQEESCPVLIDQFQEPYRTLLGYHMSIATAYTTKLKLDNAKTLDIRYDILQNLEHIILWGKEHKVALALHDSPYPFLIPEILKLVQKHYGNTRDDQHIIAKPIILLSECDPLQWTGKIIKKHGEVVSICQPTKEQIGTNSSNPIAIEMMNSITLEGGAFDIIGCMTKSVGGGNENQSHTPQIKQLLYSLRQAKQLKHRQFVTDTMQNYQDTVRETSIFAFNIFENQTSASDLAVQIKQSIIDALTKEDGHQLRMREGLEFLGFNNFFARTGRPVAEDETIKHRRRNHGDSYGESRIDATSPTLEEQIARKSSANHTKMISVHITKKQIRCPEL